MNSIRIGELIALSVAGCWALSAVAFEGASRRAGSLPVNFVRLLLAFAGFCVVGLVRHGHAIPTDAPRDAWGWLLASGAVGFFIGDLALFRAFVLIGARLSTLLMSLAPPIAAITGAILLPGERLMVMTWLGMFVTLAGIVWVVAERTAPSPEETADGALPVKSGRGGNGRASTWGIVLGVIGAAGQGVGLVLGKLGLRGVSDAFAATQIRSLAGIAGFALLIVALRDVRRIVLLVRDGRAMAMLTVGAIAGPFVGVSLLLMSMQYGVSPGVAQTFAALVPVVILPFVVVTRRERITWRAALGALVAVAGVALLLWT